MSGGGSAGGGSAGSGSSGSNRSNNTHNMENQNIPQNEGIDADTSTLPASLNGDMAESVEKTEKKKSNYTLKVITNENLWVEDSDKEAKRITDNIEEGCGGGMSCSRCTSQVLDGGDETFKDLGLHRRPYALGEQLRNIKKGSKNE